MEILGVVIVILAVLFVAFLIVGVIFYFIMISRLQHTYEAIRPENRGMHPGQVWMVLIPGYGFFWSFVVVNKLAANLQTEFNQRGIPLDEDQPGRKQGQLMFILMFCSAVPYLGLLSLVASFIVMFSYMRKMTGYKNRLLTHGGQAASRDTETIDNL